MFKPLQKKKLSAIVLCRANSKRLKYKHLKFIGTKSLIEIILNNLLEINVIDEIYIASGSRQKNFIYEKYLKNIFKKKIKFFYHKKENYVNERIYKLSKKLKNEYVLIFSGDCPLVEKKFILKIYNKFKKDENFDYIYIKNCIIEGIDVLRTSLWRKIYLYSQKTKELLENPAYIIKREPSLFVRKELFSKDIKFYQSKKKHLKLSIDTQSDLDFFRAVNKLKKRGEKLDYKTVYKYKRLKVINSHVVRKSSKSNFKNRIVIITMFTQKIGLGHYSRSETIAREINETITSDIKKIILRSNQPIKINEFIKRLQSNLFLDKIIIIDIPRFILTKLNFLFEKNKIIIIDNIINHKNIINIIPSLRKPKLLKKNCFYGVDNLILKREINYLNNIHLKKKNYILIFPGYTSSVPKKILDFCLKNKKLNFIIFSNNKNLIKVKNIKILGSNVDFLKITKEASAIISRFGVYIYECLALKQKVFVWDFNEEGERLKDINYLVSKNYIKKFNQNNFEKEIKKKFNKIGKFKFGCPNIINKIQDSFI